MIYLFTMGELSRRSQSKRLGFRRLGVRMGSKVSLVDDYTASLQRLAATTDDAVRDAVTRAKTQLDRIRAAVAQYESNVEAGPKALCFYEGLDSTAEVSTRRDESGAFYSFSRCHCGATTCERGTLVEATTALDDHRNR